MLQHLVSEAKAFARARRGFRLTGAQSIAELIKSTETDTYGVPCPKGASQVPMLAAAIDEPADPRVVEMLRALPPEKAAYYEHENNVVNSLEVNSVAFAEIQERFGFIGGTYEQYITYLNREDLPPRMWGFCPAGEAKAIAGMSTVAKKKEGRQRKLLMCCAANFCWEDPRTHHDLGLYGGGAITSLHPGGILGVSVFSMSIMRSLEFSPPPGAGGGCVPPRYWPLMFGVS